MKRLCLLLLLLFSCRHDRHVNTSFYYWKTVYQNRAYQNEYLEHLKVSRLYVRMMDIDMDENGNPVPVSPVTFKDALPKTIEIVPVVFIVNDVLKAIDTTQVKILAGHIIHFVDLRVRQAGKTSYSELQVDCDWTAATRDNYFFLLRLLLKSTSARSQTLSVTLRLHQLKNQIASGIPPARRVMLMCYNMGNLRKYGNQNSILELSELKKYLGRNLMNYPLPVNIGLPLFSWAVAFRNKQYIGLSKNLNIRSLNEKNQFKFIGKNLYRAVTDLPEYGLLKDDEVRWEAVAENDLNPAAQYISPFIKTDSINIIYFHLDTDLTNTFPYAALEKNISLFR